METQFTKGKWVVNSKGAVGVIDKSDSQSYGMMKEVCWVEDQFCKTEEEVKANANLIAVAPEMYEILYCLLKNARLFYGDDYEDLRKLLAKARGE